MPSALINGVEIHFVDRGAGVETVFLSHSYLVDHRHFEAQIDALSASYRVIAYDHRDHGASGRASAEYGLDDLVADAVGLMRHTQAAPCHFVGLSTGGFIGMRIALRHPELLRSLVLMDTSAEAESRLNRIKYRAMFLALRAVGTRPMLGNAMRLMFGPAFLRDPSRGPERELWRQRIGDNDPRALIRFGNAIFVRDSVLQQLGKVQLPTLVMAGEHDGPTPPSCARRVAQAIPDARMEVIPGAGHLCTIESPRAVNEALLTFLGEQLDEDP